MNSKFKIGDIDYLMGTLHYEILSANCTISFIESKLGGFVDQWKKDNMINLNGSMIGLSKKEAEAFFDYEYIDKNILEQFICEMLCVQVYGFLERFLYGVCELAFDKKTIGKLVKNLGKGTFAGYIDIIYGNILNLDHNTTCKQLNNWKTIRNSIVHTKSILEEYKVKYVKEIIEIDGTCAPFGYTFSIFVKDIREYLSLIENYTQSIYKELCLIIDNE